jgi:hypothetical protein
VEQVLKPYFLGVTAVTELGVNPVTRTDNLCTRALSGILLTSGLLAFGATTSTRWPVSSRSGEAKFDRSRLVPLEPTVTAALGR